MSVEGLDAAVDPTLDDVSGFQRDILFAIRGIETETGDSPHGLAIKDELESPWFGYDDVSAGRLYPNLDKLLENGLIEKSQLDQRTKQYATTQHARTVLFERHRVEADCLGFDQPAREDGGEA